MLSMSSRIQVQNTFLMILLLSLLVTIPCFSMDIYVPAMKVMTKALSTTPAGLQLTISLFLTGLSIAQLFSGLFSDAFGRKKVILIGLAIYSVMTFLCVWTTSITVFTFARLIQGMGCSVTTVCVFAIARDIFKDQTLAKILGYITAMLSISPVISPVLGGFLSTQLGWRSNFLFLTLFSVLLFLAVILFLPETNQTLGNVHDLYPRAMMKAYLLLFKNKAYIFLSILVALVYASFFAYLYNVSFLFEKNFIHSFQIIGLLIGLNAFALFLGSFIAARLVVYMSINKIIKIGLILILISSFLMSFSTFIFKPLPVFLFSGYMFFCTLGVAAIVPMANSKALSMVKHHFGSAAALSGFIRYGLASLLGMIIAATHIVSVLLVGITLFIMTALGYQFFIKSENLMKD